MSFEAFKKDLQDPKAFDTVAPAQPVLSRKASALPEALQLLTPTEPMDIDPLAEGVLMPYQAAWIADTASFKICEKGRRTGITWAEATDATLIAAAARSAGGQNYFYIGDTKDKAREFIGYVAQFARVMAKELVAVEEFVFADQKADGTSQEISAFRIKFASGYRVEGLSSRPENIRGLQGVVCIDEAAFHKDVRRLLDSVTALLIWGGKIRIISTHNGVLNAFNEMVAEARAKKLPASVHFIPFGIAIEQGLYHRVCLYKGEAWTAEGEAKWEANIRAAYGVRTAAMRQELDCIPAEQEGSALTRVQIEACMALPGAVPLIRWTLPDSFKDLGEQLRKATTRDWCEKVLLPILAALDPTLTHYYGQDFARSGDASDILIAAEERTLVRTSQLLVELRNVPFETQRDVLFFIIDHLPRFGGGANDATGNGAYLAEVARQKYGERVLEVKFTTEWYRQNSPAYIEAFSDRTILLPRHEDVLRDHQALAYVGGVVKVPDDFRFKGSDGLDRHGDSAIAGMLMWYASLQGRVDYGYRGSQSAGGRPLESGGGPRWRDQPDHSGDGASRRGWWTPPLGTSKFGGY